MDVLWQLEIGIIYGAHSLKWKLLSGTYAKKILILPDFRLKNDPDDPRASALLGS